MEPDWFPSAPPWKAVLYYSLLYHVKHSIVCFAFYALCALPCCFICNALVYQDMFVMQDITSSLSMWVGQDFFMLVDATGDEWVTGMSKDSKGLNEFLILRLVLWQHLLFSILLGHWFVFNCTKLTLGVSQPWPSYMLASWPAWAGHPEAITGPLVAQLEGFNKSLQLNDADRCSIKGAKCRLVKKRRGCRTGETSSSSLYLTALHQLPSPLNRCCNSLCPRLPVIHMWGPTVFLCLCPRSNRTWPAKVIFVCWCVSDAAKPFSKTRKSIHFY